MTESIKSFLEKQEMVRDGLSYFNGCLEEFVDLISSITSIPAPSNDERERGQYIEKIMNQWGFPQVQTDQVGNVLAYFPGKDSSRVIVSMAHMDTVFSRDQEIKVKREGNLLKAPGVSDNSASVAGMLLLGKVFSRYTPLPHPLILIANVGEEGLGDLKGSRYFCDHVEEYDFQGLHLDPKKLVFLNIDGNMGNLVNAGIGSRRLKITFTGQGGHSWGDFGNSSAVHGLGVAIAKIAKIQVPSDPKTTFNVGVIKGGHSVNSIAQSAEMLLDMRSLSEKCLEKLEKDVLTCLKEAADETRTEFSFRVVGDRPQGKLDPESGLVKGILQLGRECGYDLNLEASSTDSNIPLSRGWPAVTMGFKRSENTHKVTEFLYIDSLVPGIKFALLCFAGLLYDKF